MTTITFDTLSAANDLRAAGFDEPQSNAIITAMGKTLIGNVAMKSDIADLRSDAGARNSELKADIADVRTEIAEFRTEVAELRAELKGDIADVRTEVAGLRTELKGDIAELRNHTDAAMSQFRTDMQAMELRITLRLGGFMIAALGLAAAILRFFA